jgi:hypothetical protein
MTGRERRAVVAVCVLLVAGLVAVPVGAVHDTGRKVVVDVRADGNATVTFERSYNLTIPAERDRFEAVVNNSTALEQRRTAFAERLRDGATNGSARTARDMAIENVTVSTRRVNDTGVVAVRARWANLAGVYGPQVVVNEPFSTSYDPNATLVVRGPDGYVREQVSPRPSLARLNSAFWGADVDLRGFSARFIDPDATPTPAENGGDSATPAPEPTGVGRAVGAAGFALVPALLVLFGAKWRDLLVGGSGGGSAADGPSDGGSDGDAGAGEGSETGADATDASSDGADDGRAGEGGSGTDGNGSGS